MRSKVFFFLPFFFFLVAYSLIDSKADFITYISTDRKTSLGVFEINGKNTVGKKKQEDDKEEEEGEGEEEEEEDTENRS